jgi:hypothetical protein
MLVHNSRCSQVIVTTHDKTTTSISSSQFNASLTFWNSGKDKADTCGPSF